jgi:transposase
MSLNEALGIKQFNASHFEVKEGEVLIYGKLEQTGKTCPKCCKEALKPHQYYQKRVRHIPMFNLPTWLVFDRKDWICGCGKVFLERLEFQDLRSDYTRGYEEYLYHLGKHMAWNAVARQEGLNWDTVERIFKKGGQPASKADNGRLPVSG